MIRFRIERKKKKKKKTEFSKKLLIISYLIGILIIAYAMFIQLLIISSNYQGDSSIVTGLIAGAFAEMGVVSGFYKWKAKAENIVKLQKLYGEEMIEKIKNEEDV